MDSTTARRQIAKELERQIAELEQAAESIAAAAELALPGPGFVLNEKQLRGCFYGSARLRDDIPRLLRLYYGRQLMLDELVTASFPLERVNDAVDVLDRGDGLRTILQVSAA
jgi:Zn-dependent alcohol dehydrogenase